MNPELDQAHERLRQAAARYRRALDELTEAEREHVFANEAVDRLESAPAVSPELQK